MVAMLVVGRAGQLPEGDGVFPTVKIIGVLILLSGLLRCPKINSDELLDYCLPSGHIFLPILILSFISFALKSMLFFSSAHRYPQGPEESLKDWIPESQRNSIPA